MKSDTASISLGVAGRFEDAKVKLADQLCIAGLLLDEARDGVI